MIPLILKQALTNLRVRPMRVEYSGSHTRMFGYTKNLAGDRSKRALLSYLADTVVAEAKGQSAHSFSNHGIARTWPQVLNRLGYTVDIINWNDAEFRPHREYDLLIQHGGKNFSQLKQGLKEGGRVIYFSTGSYWKFHNAQEEKRLVDFKNRHGVELPPDRYISDSEEEANRGADCIICLGNMGTKQTYASFPCVINLPVGSFPDPRANLLGRNFTETRQNFVFFSGGGNVHKGLDLLLDAFSNSPYQLYICSVIDEQFKDFYRQALASPNVHCLGFIEPRTEQYYEIMAKCAFSILPSCSEGSPGSVVETMQAGIVPIVSEEAHLDTEKFGINLKDTSTAEIAATIKRVSAMSESEYAQRSKLARQAALTEYSPESFAKRLQQALSEALCV